MKTLNLTNLHQQVIYRIKSETPFSYHQYTFSKIEKKALDDLVASGEVLKTVIRTCNKGKYSTRVFLTLKK